MYGKYWGPIYWKKQYGNFYLNQLDTELFAGTTFPTEKKTRKNFGEGIFYECTFFIQRLIA